MDEVDKNIIRFNSMISLGCGKTEIKNDIAKEAYKAIEGAIAAGQIEEYKSGNGTYERAAIDYAKYSPAPWHDRGEK